MSQRRKKMKQVIALLLITAMVFVSIQMKPEQVLAAKKEQLMTTYQGDGYVVTFKITNQWADAFNADVSIKNTSNKVIDNWAIGFALPYQITKIWNGVVASSDDGFYAIKNSGSNQDIPVGKSVSFGFTASADEILVLPRTFLLLMNEVNVESDAYQVMYRTTSDWRTGFNGEITIKNNSDSVLEDWSLEFDFPYKIERFWTAEISTKVGNHYLIKNVGYNANIKPNETVTLGFSANPGNVISELENVKMMQIILDEDIFNQDFDMDKLDNDYELLYGTNPYLADTDNDELNDYFEINFSNTNPLLVDSDNDGIIDGNEDLDGDELSIVLELQNGTNNFISDTDYDGLKDYDEIYIQKTNPLKKDTDEDGISDGDEITLGLDPLDQTSFEVLDSEFCIEHTISAENKCFANINNDNSPYRISLDIYAAGNVAENLSVEISDYSNIIQSDAIVGLIPQLTYDKNMKVENVRLKFQMEDNYIGQLTGEDEELPEELKGIKRYNIFKYFEQDGLLLPIKTNFDIDKNVIYADVDELGTYCIIDLLKWSEIMGYSGDTIDKSTESYSINSMSLDEETSLTGVDEKDNESNEEEPSLSEPEDNDQEYNNEEQNPPIVNEQSDSDRSSKDIKSAPNFLSINRSVSQMIQNDYIEFCVGDNGLFTLGTVNGNPDLSTDSLTLTPIDRHVE